MVDTYKTGRGIVFSVRAVPVNGLKLVLLWLDTGSYTHIPQGYITGTKELQQLPQGQWSDPEEYR